MKTQLSLAALFLSMSVMAQGLVSTYSSIELQKCSKFESGEGGVSAECHGPDNVVLEISNGDWTNMWIRHKGKRFETWNLLTAVGSFTRIGGDNQVAEWILDKSVEGQSTIHSLITRVSGTNPNTQASTSRLLVFGFTQLAVCYRGDSTSNMGARKLAESNECSKALPMALPKPREIATRISKGYINKIKLENATVHPDGKGEFLVSVNHCISSFSKEAASFAIAGQASPHKNITLGGAYSTQQATPLTFTYKMDVPKGVALADACRTSTTKVTLRCDILPGYDGAGCNFKVNDDHIIAVESFKNGYSNALLMPAK
ncbi:MAG: hypothetical protein B7Y39_02270 [Bdellovibrio sp. 28-41-41]|nr:MAG: hypothetical protein B7Y39_02270 [Bdellovibrio sp. 28-41-41]